MMIGINISGAEFGGTGGTHNYQYHYPTFDELKYYAEKGVELIRLPFRWERMQPSLGGPLDAEELALIKQVLSDAAALGLKVIIDCHNYGRYDGQTIGSATGPTNAQFADFWLQLASELKDSPALAGYDIMNEPHDMGGPGVWRSAAQAAVDAIRTVDMNTQIHIEGEGWSAAHTWLQYNADLILTDPANNLVYQAHQYFDHYNQGFYANSYDAEGAYPMIGVDRLQPFVEWLAANGLQGFLGEFGVPSDDPRWLEVLENTVEYMNEVGLDGTAWGGGAWWPESYSMFMGAPGVADSAYLDLLENYFELGSALSPLLAAGSEDGDSLSGTFGEDHLLGLGGDDVVSGSAGSDIIDGGLGIDTVDYYSSSAAVDVDLTRGLQWHGDAQGDQLVGIENVTGSAFADMLSGNAEANVLCGLEGDDVLTGGGGGDVLTGGAGNDRFVFDSATNADGDSVTDFAAGDQFDFSQLDANVLVTGAQPFTLIGAAEFTGAAGEMRVTTDLATNRTIVSADVDGDRIADFAVTVAGIHSIAQSALLGTVLPAPTAMRGTSRSDSLIGTEHRDLLFGMSRNDTLNGRGGADTLTGGAGSDRFVFDSASNADGDRVTDCGRWDRLDFSAIDADSTIAGDQSFTFIGSEAFTGVAGQLRTYADNNSTYVAGDVTGDGIADFTVALDNMYAITATGLIL